MTTPNPSRPLGSRPARSALIAALCGLAIAPAAAQTGSDAPTDAIRLLPDVMRPERVVMPTRERAAVPVSPGLTQGQRWDDGSEPAALPEGTFLIERPGRVIEAPGGRRVFIPDVDHREPGEGPMLLQPSASLERLEITLAGTTGPVRLSGVVTVYHGRRHLLMSSFLMGDGEPEPGAEPAADPEAKPSEATTEPAAEPDPTPESMLDDPEVRGLLEELEAEAPLPTRADPSIRTGNAQPINPQTTSTDAPPAPDGTPIVRRLGRLSRSADGAWLFVFDNDIDDRLAAQTLTLLPCRLLERIERDAETRGDAAQMVLSGRVYTHQGDAYMMPTMMRRARPIDVVPMR